MTWLEDFASVTGVGFGGVLALAAIRQLPRGVRWLFEFFGGRMDRRADALDQGTERLIAGLEKRLNAVTERLDRVERELADCQKKHAESEAKAARLEALIGLTSPGMKAAFAVDRSVPVDMAVMAAKLDGGKA